MPGGEIKQRKRIGKVGGKVQGPPPRKRNRRDSQLEETGSAKALQWREKGAVAESAREAGGGQQLPCAVAGWAEAKLGKGSIHLRTDHHSGGKEEVWGGVRSPQSVPTHSVTQTPAGGSPSILPGWP